MADRIKAGMSGQFDPAKLKKVVEDIEGQKAEIRTISASNAKRISGKKDLIETAIGEAEKDGVPKKVMKLVLDVRDNRRKEDEAREALEPAQQDLFDQALHALGMLDDQPKKDPVQAMKASAAASDKALRDARAPAN